MAKQQNQMEQVVDVVSRDDMVRKDVGLVFDERMILHHCPWDPHHIETPDRLKVIWNRCQVFFYTLINMCINKLLRSLIITISCMFVCLVSIFHT